MTLPAGARLGPYEIVALIGRGGMGEVYRAHDTTLKRDVALMTQTLIELPANAPLALGSPVSPLGFDGPVIAISPDGRNVAYVGQLGAGTQLYVRAMGATDVRPIIGTEGAIHPFFSPDGQTIGFLTNDRVKRVPLEGGTVVTICDARTPLQAWWLQTDVIYFSEDQGRQLSRVAVDGGRLAKLIETFPAIQQSMRRWKLSDVLPSGKAVLATAWYDGISCDYSDVVLVSTETLETKLLIRSGYGARFVPPGYIVFAHAGNLLAARFDVDRLA